MSNSDRDIDLLLRQNAERQLAGLDWDRQRQRVMERLAGARKQKPQVATVIGIGAGIAAILALAVGYICISVLPGTGRDAARPAEATAIRAYVGDDSLLASTDPTTILLTGPVRLLVLNDPTLAPHSAWDQ